MHVKPCHQHLVKSNGKIFDLIYLVHDALYNWTSNLHFQIWQIFLGSRSFCTWFTYILGVMDITGQSDTFPSWIRGKTFLCNIVHISPHHAHGNYQQNKQKKPCTSATRASFLSKHNLNSKHFTWFHNQPSHR